MTWAQAFTLFFFWILVKGYILVNQVIAQIEYHQNNEPKRKKGKKYFFVLNLYTNFQFCPQSQFLY